MKKVVSIIAITVVLSMAFVIPAVAGDEKHGKEMHKTMDHSDHTGMLIHESSVDGHKLAYHLIDMKEKMKGMKNMPEMKDTHHLMLFIEDAHGHKMEKGKVGYLVTGPGDSKQKLMCMGMKGGFGADVNLGAKGVYTIKAKVMAGDKKLQDEFTYEVK